MHSFRLSRRSTFQLAGAGALTALLANHVSSTSDQTPGVEDVRPGENGALPRL